MTTNTRAELADAIAAAIERFHDALPQGQGETGDGGAAGRELCQLFYDNSDTILSALRGQGEGWQAIDENTPVACHVLAARFDPSFGEWVLGFVASPPTKPFTHWRFVAPPSQTGGDDGR